MRNSKYDSLNTKSVRSSLLTIAMSATLLTSHPTLAQTSYEVIQYKKDMLELVLQCPETGTDYRANITQCVTIEQKLRDRRAADTARWRWADDRLQRMLWLLEGRLVGNYFKRDKRRSPDMCRHAEKAWLNLNRISIRGRVEYDQFFHVRASIHGVIDLCRKEIGTPEWGAPMILGKPSPK